MMKSIARRDLGRISVKGNNYTLQEQHIQQVLAVASASISMLSGFVSFYWFATMKRKYRHEYVVGVRPPGFEASGC